ncbi:MAG: diguanylate cyclase [Helicobacteraceae bacterium]|nr:diguanylate cyclase [Helicobacteraceae bacterium]
MYTQKKILFNVALMLLLLMIATIVNVGFNFREYSHKSAEEKAVQMAENVRDGLTIHMAQGIMDQRKSFLSNVAGRADVNELWLVRSQLVTEQYGLGFPDESPRDAIDKHVLQTGKIEKVFTETAKETELRITIPYIASAYSTPDCLTCHNVNQGDVLGAITIKMDVSNARTIGIISILKIFGMNILFMLFALYLINRFSKPYFQLFSELNTSLEKASAGDFSHTVNTKLSNEAGEVTKNLNQLLTTMDGTFGGIKNKLSVFISPTHDNIHDPLQEAQIVIDELSDIYKFKKTIELDNDKEAIYDRIIYLLHNEFNIEAVSLFEIDITTKERVLIYIDDGRESWCSEETLEDSKKCRACRISHDVVSTDFHKVCNGCIDETIEYLCLPFQINEQKGLLFSFSSESKEEIERIQTILPAIKNILQAAKPVLESKLLMQILLDSSRKDPLTGLYNRRYMEEYIDHSVKQALRMNVGYGVLMVDIDHFKMVNDTYGHDVGDSVIRKLSIILKESVRDADLAIRYGGEEFIILLYNPTEEGAMEVAEKIRETFFSLEFTGNNEKFRKSLSIGVSMFPTDADAIWQAIKYADLALYKAKNTGRDRTIRFTQDMVESENY